MTRRLPRTFERAVEPALLRCVLSAGLALLLAGPVTLWAAPAGAVQTSAPSLDAELDQLVQWGQDHPLRALDRISELAAQGGQARQKPRPLALARGLVAAAADMPSELQAALVALAALAPDPVAAADAALVRAAAAHARGDTGAALEAATAALMGYNAACNAGLDCDHRTRWRALQVLTRQERQRGLYSAALTHALTAVELAGKADDAARQAQALADAADLAGLQNDGAAEQRYIEQAQRLGRADGTPLLLSRLQLYETRLQRRRGDAEAARRAANTGLALARQAGSARLAAIHLVNLSDVLVTLAQPQAALQAINAALPVVRAQGDRGAERALMHNAALAHLGLGQMATARRKMDAALDAYRKGGASADHAAALREFGDAFAAAGDTRSALLLFHQERALAAEIMASSREAALSELRQRFDREAQQRRLEQLSRERVLLTAELANRGAMQKVWAAGAAVLLLAGVLVALMYRRVRQLTRRLEDNQALLREQSHRDPLTGLHNRRGLYETAAARGLLQHFEGALMLLDIDHFKRINDGHGHAAGDAVLVEVARRLSDAVREDDLLVRWGGEEFLVCVNRSSQDTQADAVSALSQRVLDAVSATPVALPGGGALRVTVSVGYACFPLPPAGLPLALERAINLVDMALYTAKNQGRNNAMGIVMTAAHEDKTLCALEADFDLARSEGRVVLERLNGPAAQALPNLDPANEQALNT